MIELDLDSISIHLVSLTVNDFLNPKFNQICTKIANFGTFSHSKIPEKVCVVYS